MFSVILNNLLYVAFAFGIFALCVVANIVVSVYHNVSDLKQVFNGKKLLDGLIKMLSVGFGTAILAVVVSLIPYLVSYVGVTFSDEAESIFTIGSIILLYFGAIKKYYSEAYKTTKNVLENENIIENNAK